MAETGTMRVGVVSENAALFIALTLQGHGIDVVRLTDPANVEGLDVVFLDVPTMEIATAWLDALPELTPCVVTGPDVQGDRAMALPRPYSMTELVTALGVAARGEVVQSATGRRTSEVAVSGGPIEDRPLDLRGDTDIPVVGSSAIGSPDTRTNDSLFEPRTVWPSSGSRDLASVDVSRPAQEAEVDELPGSVGHAAHRRHGPRVGSAAKPLPPGGTPRLRSTETVDVPLVDPLRVIGQRAAELSELLVNAPFVVTVARFAGGLAEVLAVEFGAENVALWSAPNDHLQLLGAHGLTQGERRLAPHLRHPMLEEARRHGGVVWENLDAGSPLTAGLPGARTPTFAVALIASLEVPVDVITVGSRGALTGCLQTVDAIVAEGMDGWRAAKEVEQLGRRLSH